MNDSSIPDFEIYVRSQLSAILISVQNLQSILDRVSSKSDEIIGYTEELSETMPTLLGTASQTNVLLGMLDLTLKTELRETRVDLKEANKNSSNKFSPWIVGLMVIFMLAALGVINRVSMEGMGVKFAAPVVDQLKDNLKAADERADKTAKVLLDTVGQDGHTK